MEGEDEIFCNAESRLGNVRDYSGKFRKVQLRPKQILPTCARRVWRRRLCVREYQHDAHPSVYNFNRRARV